MISGEFVAWRTASTEIFCITAQSDVVLTGSDSIVDGGAAAGVFSGKTGVGVTAEVGGIVAFRACCTVPLPPARIAVFGVAGAANEAADNTAAAVATARFIRDPG